MKAITIAANFDHGAPKYDSQTSFDRSSFIPFHQRPAVDSLIREWSMREKKRNTLTQLIDSLDAGKVVLSLNRGSNAGQFDTSNFRHGSALIEEDEEDSGKDLSHEVNPKVVPHVIACSMSSDEESSVEEFNEFATETNRPSTIAQVLKNNVNGQMKMNENKAGRSLSNADNEEGMSLFIK